MKQRKRASTKDFVLAKVFFMVSSEEERISWRRRS